MAWDEALHSLGLPEMDDTHREFLEMVETARAARGEVFARLFGELLTHTEAHFAHESTMMAACRFSAITAHEGEHQRVLAELRRMADRLAQGHGALARAYLDGLPDWFRSHLAMMDSALAGQYRQYLATQKA